MNFRRLVAEDATEFCALRLDALRESPSSFGSACEDEELRTQAEWASLLAASEERVFFGAFSSADLVASVGIQRESGRKERHRAFVRGMYVEPSSRCAGVGRRLLSIAISHATCWVGLEQVTLAVTSSNLAAVSLYRSDGFAEYGVAPRVLLIEGTYYDESLLVRHLSAA